MALVVVAGAVENLACLQAWRKERSETHSVYSSTEASVSSDSSSLSAGSAGVAGSSLLLPKRRESSLNIIAYYYILVQVWQRERERDSY